MTLERRDFLKGAVLLAAAPLVACEAAPADEPAVVPLPVYAWTGEPGPASLFRHGVASGDPLPDGVILWTRVSPADVAATVGVFWEMATDEAFAHRVAAGTSMQRDLTVKVAMVLRMPWLRCARPRFRKWRDSTGTSTSATTGPPTGICRR